MLVAGAGGLAAQLFDELVAINAQNICFWSEVPTKYDFIKTRFSIIGSDKEVEDFFNSHSKAFILCIGGIDNRKKIAERFTNLGGKISSFISHNSTVSPYASIGTGSVVLSRVEIEAGVTVGKRCLVNKTANIGHGCIIGDDCEITPGVILAGEVEVGKNTFIGMRSIILPKVKIGENVVIAAGAIVKKNVPDNAVVAGEFAAIKFYRKN